MIGEKVATEARKSVDVGAVEDFPIGNFRLMEVGRRQIGVLRIASGKFYAVNNYCPHRGAPICSGEVGGTMLPSEPGQLRYGMDSQVLRCPWHAFEFDLESGDSVLDDSRLRLRTYPVKITDGRVRVILDRKDS